MPKLLRRTLKCARFLLLTISRTKFVAKPGTPHHYQNKGATITKKQLLATIALAFASNAAFASPAEDVITPDIEKGEREFEFAYGTDRNDAGEYESALELSFGAGVTDRWATELGVEFERERGEHMKYSGIEWENRLGLIIDEEAPVALSLLVGFERPRERAEGWSSTLGLLSETTVGRFLVNANLLIERSWDVDADDEDDEDGDDDEARTTLGYQWQVLYRHSHRIYYGVQGMGELGEWDDWAKRDDQEHKVGPAIFGRLKTAGGQRLNYNAGLLFGVTDGTPDYTLRLKLEYEL